MTIPTYYYICSQKTNNLSILTLHKINNLETLVNALNSGNFSAVEDQFEDLILPISEFSSYIFWNKEHYTRNCIAKDDNFELLVLCWEEGQKTPIHGHDNQECWVKVIDGSFEEATYLTENACYDQKPDSIDGLKQNEITSIEKQSTFHCLSNSNAGRSISLHLYMKPIAHCLYANVEKRRLETAQLSYYSLEGKLV